MSRNVLNGRIVEISSKSEADKITEGCRVRHNKFTQPGRYMILSYLQRCPRDCCYEDVCEIISIKDVVEEIVYDIPSELAIDIAKRLIEMYSPEEEDFDDV
jgi:hypothetical protein